MAVGCGRWRWRVAVGGGGANRKWLAGGSERSVGGWQWVEDGRLQWVMFSGGGGWRSGFK